MKKKRVSRRELTLGATAAGLAGCKSGERDAAAEQRRPADALGDLDGVGVASRIRLGEITSVQAVEAAIARAERVGPRLNFIATRCYDLARARAGAAPTGPFGGVPTLIKDLLALKGVKLMFGSRAFADNVADSQPAYTDALLAAGLVPIGKSTTPEFGYTATTEPILTGITRNPWNLDHSSGGSSGGSAAAVAAGVVPVADASDGGGSIRIPASCCGLVGLKPSRGRMRDFGRGDPPPVDIAVVGCVSRSVRDTATWLASAERAGRNQVYAPVGVVAGPNQRRLRIGLAIKDTMGRDPDPQVRAAIEDVAELCRSLRHEVREFRPPIDGEAFAQAFTLYWASDAAQTTADLRRAHPNRPISELLEPLTLALDEIYRRAPRGALNGAIETLRRSESQYAEMFSGIDVLLTPVLARPPARIGDYTPTRPETFTSIGDYVAYTPLQNAAGAPAIALPLSMSADNLPIGAHFCAAKGEERMLLELAYELEFARPWAARKPPVWAG